MEAAAEEGERCPFGVPFGGEVVEEGGSFGRGGDCAMFVIRDLGLRLRARARSSAKLEGGLVRLVTGLLMGAK